MADKQDYSDFLSGTKLKDYKVRFEHLKRTADEFIEKRHFLNLDSVAISYGL